MKQVRWQLTVGICLLFSTLLMAQAPEEREKVLTEIQSKIAENNKKIQPVKEQVKRMEKNLGVISRELRYTELQLQQTKSQLNTVKTKEHRTSEQIQGIEAKYHQQEEKMKQRLSEIYKMKRLGFIEFLFSGKGMVSHSDGTFYFDRIIKNDVDMIEDIQSECDLLKRKKTRLAKQTEQIDHLQDEIVEKETDLQKKQVQHQRVIATLQEQIEQMEKENAELEQESMEITRFIQERGRTSKGYYGTGSFIKPVNGWISSGFGPRKHPIFKRIIVHHGIDIAAPQGYKIRAADSGYVIVAGQKPRYRGYGKIVVLDHGRNKEGNIVSTFYAHQSRILVQEGDFVVKGQEIGWVGSTGFSTGPHLHFEIRMNGIPVDPMRYVK